jgi:hypothetical protein
MRVRGCVAPLIVSVALAACASETPPLDPESVPLPRPAPKLVAAAAAATSSKISNSAVHTLAASSATSERRGIKARQGEMRTGGQNGFEHRFARD